MIGTQPGDHLALLTVAEPLPATDRTDRTPPGVAMVQALIEIENGPTLVPAPQLDCRPTLLVIVSTAMRLTFALKPNWSN